ncbi:Conserved hypothetical protein, putative [Brugia malayi]|uniref:CC domain-containing protein n=2 Tax=Brugia malayi TaxID=6279 RepID=A0A4E9F8M7_BRUMA|nr:Conserved hypothetical protein, putative [Brugia malayi]VIO92382.1 Conserved hypothetical protein, putative [Brugia malayi]
MRYSAIYFNFLTLTISNLFHVISTQQLTPIIGGKCDANSSDVPIGGKGTQFFLRCEQSLQSENGKGVWVVKSRTLSTTTSQTTPTIPVITILPLENKQESYQTLKSNNDIICVEDKSAQSGDPCSVSSVCLQQEQGQLSSNYLQCDQSTNQWMRKSCLDGRIFSFEHQTCITSDISAFRQSRLGTRYYGQSAPNPFGGIACSFTQCSQNNPCHRGTCNNGYCCTSSNGPVYTTLLPYHQQSLQMNQFPFSIPHQMQPAHNPTAFNGCANGGSPVGTCINMRCARGYFCSPGNICCPSNDFGTMIGSTANPMKNPFLCTDGTQAAGACILGQCGSSFTCMNGLCCNVTNNTPRCLDGSPSVGACISGHCGAGFVCTTGNLCCLTNTIANIIPGTCPNNAASIGTCINGLCPTGYTCINGQCCPQTDKTFRCSNLNYALGPCVAGQCPDGGFQCDMTINSCCPVTDPVGPCIEPGDQCPAGNTCFKEGSTPLCYKECDGRGTVFGPPVDGVCPTGTTLIFGSCCTLRARLHNPIQSSFFSERHADFYSWPTTSGMKLCPDNTGPISACINGQCGYDYQCYNNVCCLPQYNNVIFPLSLTALRPIGASCEFTQQCVNSMEGLSICELGICRCLPGAQVNGFYCVKRFSIPLNDAGQSSKNGTSVDESDAVGTGS